MNKIFFLTLSLIAGCMFSYADNSKVTVYDNSASQIPYRIPAIVKDKDGNLLAMADYRYGKGDIGYGRIDIYQKISTDNGATWGKQNPIIQGNEKETGFGQAHGDAAVVCDSESGKLLLMCASGRVAYSSSSRQEPIRVGRYYSTDKGNTWTGTEITETMYQLFPDVTKMFFGSGRICQSRQIKTGSYYRLYAALCTDRGSLVVYSDDFGDTWQALGGSSAQPAPSGDEPKCEELPDGNVLLSSRMCGGRYFNIYSYTDKANATGSWGTVAVSGNTNNGTVAERNSCNGEILIVPATRKSDNGDVYVALQSVPFSATQDQDPKRSNVGIYYKELTSKADFASPSVFADNWTPFPVSTTTSAYSTMVLDNDGNIAFLYEENERNGGYDIQFQSFSLETITDSKYSYNSSLDNDAFLNREGSGDDIVADEWAGKVLLMKAQGNNASGTFSYYIRNNGVNFESVEASEAEKGSLDYTYYWVVSKDPESNYYYLSSLNGDGYIGFGESTDYSSGVTTLNGVSCTDEHENEFHITGFVKNLTGSDVQMDGYAIKFEYKNKNGYTDGTYRVLAVSDKGEVNWYNRTTMGDNESNQGRDYWTTNFVLTEVTHTEERESYGTFDTPTYFGFPVKFTRHDDTYKANSYEDYNRYATLKLPFAVTLDTDIKVWKIESLDPTPGSQVKLTEYTLTDNVLPRETPVLLGIDGAQYDGKVTETRYFKPALAQEIKETGFSGTLGKKTFSGYNGYRGSGNTGDYGDTYYILSKEDGRVAFRYLLGNEITNNKAYYVYKASGTAAPSMITFSFGGKETTGMEKSIAVETEDNGNIYDLFGRKAGNTDRKGIYIKNGKKFVVK